MVLRAPISVDPSGHMSQATGPSGFRGSLADWKYFFRLVSLYCVDLDTIFMHEDVLFDVTICIYYLFCHV